MRLAAELEQEKAEHADTKETLGREVGASSKIGKKKLDAAKMELTKVWSGYCHLCNGLSALCYPVFAARQQCTLALYWAS